VLISSRNHILLMDLIFFYHDYYKITFTITMSLMMTFCLASHTQISCYLLLPFLFNEDDLL
jgi:hypothetical protein